MASSGDTKSQHGFNFGDFHSRSYSASSIADDQAFHDAFIAENFETKDVRPTQVYDIRGANGSFVNGKTVLHSCKNPDDLRIFIQGKFNRIPQKAINVLIEPNEEMRSCIIINTDQMAEIQLLVSFPVDFSTDDEYNMNISTSEERVMVMLGLHKVTKCISVANDKLASFLFDTYTRNIEGVDCMFCSNKALLVRRAQASLTPIHSFSTFDKLHFYQDCPKSLKFVYHIDEQREMVFYLQCLKCDSVKDIQEKLTSQFDELRCQLDNKTCLWITDSTSVLNPSDFIFLRETGFEGNLFVQVSDHESLHMQFIFNKMSFVVIIPKAATVKEFREQAGKVLHKPANSLKVTCNKEKCDDSKLISDIGKTPLMVALASEKRLTFTKVQHGETADDKIDIKVYKMDTILDVKRKLAFVVGVDPFYIKLVQNASFLEDKATIHSSRIQASDFLQIIICPNRVQITLRFRKEQHCLVVDDAMITTVSDLKMFCGHELQCHPLTLSIYFKGSVLFDNARTLLDEGIANGSLLFAVITCQDNNSHRDVQLITLFIQGCDNGIRSQKLINVRGKVIPVDDSFQLPEPDPATAPAMHYPRPKGIQIVPSDKSILANASYNLLENQRAYFSDCKRCRNQNVDMAVMSCERRMMCETPSKQTVSATSVDKEASMSDSNMEISTIPSITQTSVTSSNLNSSATTTSLASSSLPSNLGIPPTTLAVSVNPASMPSIASMQPPSVLPSDHVVCTEVHRMVKSPSGELLSATRTQSVVYCSPEKLMGLPISDSEGLHASNDSSCIADTSTPTVKHLKHAIPERVLNALADELGNSWSNLALELSISFNDVMKITHNEPKDLKRQALIMLHKWQQANGSNATIDTLCAALHKCELVLLAEWLKEIVTEQLPLET